MGQNPDPELSDKKNQIRTENPKIYIGTSRQDSGSQDDLKNPIWIRPDPQH
jgi:hypothetical protein